MTYEQKLQKAKRKAEIVKEKQNIEMIRHYYDKPKKKLQFSKLMLLFLLVNCTVIEVFSMFCIWHFGDTSPLISLIGAVCTETIGCVAYLIKSSRENQGITHDVAMREQDRLDAEAGFIREGGLRPVEEDEAMG